MRTLSTVAALALFLSLLTACGGGGLFDSTPSSTAVLSEALYISSTGTYTYRADHDVFGIPPEADMQRIAVAGGAPDRLFALEQGGAAVYVFEERQAGVFTPANAFRVPIEGAPAYTSYHQIATVNANGRLRLYLQSERFDNVFFQFAYVQGVSGPVFRYGADDVLASLIISDMPGDADLSRFSFHHAGSTYRFMCHRSGSDSVMYQAGWRAAIGRYEYGYASRDAVLISMPSGASPNSKVLHDGSSYRAYRLRRR